MPAFSWMDVQWKSAGRARAAMSLIRRTSWKCCTVRGCKKACGGAPAAGGPYEAPKHIPRGSAEGLSADAKGTCDTVGKFVKTLPPIEREHLLGSIPGDNFLKLASESDCGSMLHAPAIANHITVR